MTLKKQSIRKNMIILANNKLITKEELITESENWSESQELFFKKMIKQGGTFNVNKIQYKVSIEQRDDLDSKGNKPVNLPLSPGERSF
jgi:transcription initiation factor IIE alpha subunit